MRFRIGEFVRFITGDIRYISTSYIQFEIYFDTHLMSNNRTTNQQGIPYTGSKDSPLAKTSNRAAAPVQSRPSLSLPCKIDSSYRSSYQNDPNICCRSPYQNAKPMLSVVSRVFQERRGASILSPSPTSASNKLRSIMTRVRRLRWLVGSSFL
ncbi:hypothetical protein BDW62DRAFT_176086 [Aspergillus aurantiobrunneus]